MPKMLLKNKGLSLIIALMWSVEWIPMILHNIHSPIIACSYKHRGMPIGKTFGLFDSYDTMDQVLHHDRSMPSIHSSVCF